MISRVAVRTSLSLCRSRASGKHRFTTGSIIPRQCSALQPFRSATLFYGCWKAQVAAFGGELQGLSFDSSYVGAPTSMRLHGILDSVCSIFRNRIDRESLGACGINGRFWSDEYEGSAFCCCALRRGPVDSNLRTKPRADKRLGKRRGIEISSKVVKCI